MEFETLIAERYSVRNFQPQHLPQEVLDRILAAGHLAPTGCNYQPQRILVLNTDEAIAKLQRCTKCHFHAPCAMLVMGYPAEDAKPLPLHFQSRPLEEVMFYDRFG